MIIVPPINNNDPTCRVLVNTPLNFRTGPGINYNIISLLATGTVAPITGRVGDNSWYQIRVGVTTGWVSSGYITLYGNCQNVGIPPIPPTPTPHYTPTLICRPAHLTTTPQPPTQYASTGSARPGGDEPESGGRSARTEWRGQCDGDVLGDGHKHRGKPDDAVQQHHQRRAARVRIRRSAWLPV